jgi:hypothetical protein
MAWPSYLTNSQSTYQLTSSLTPSSLLVLLCASTVIISTFLLCFYHSLLTNPLFAQVRRLRRPLLVPPPPPTTHAVSWIPICFFMADSEIVKKVGTDAYCFLRFHRLSLRILLQTALFSFTIILPANYFGSEYDNDEFGDVVIHSDFSRFSVANLTEGSSKFWLHTTGIYLLTFIMVRELLAEYSQFIEIRHQYLLSREPHLRTVLVTNIPPAMRSESALTTYFDTMFRNGVRSAFLCQRLDRLSYLVEQREAVIDQIEQIAVELQLKFSSETTKYRLGAVRRCTSIVSSNFLGYGKAHYVSLKAALENDLVIWNNLVAEELLKRKAVMGDLNEPLHSSELANEVYDKAFVSFKTHLSASIAVQSVHGPSALPMRVVQAPEPRAIIWENMRLSSAERGARSAVADAFVIALILCYAVPIALLSMMVSQNALISRFPTIAKLSISSRLFSFLVSSIQPICIVALQQTLPLIFNSIGRLQGKLCFANITLLTFKRYYSFLVVNVLLTTIVSNTIFDTFGLLAENPGQAFQLLGYSLPKTSSFFFNYVAIRIVALGLELTRVPSIVKSLVRATFFAKLTRRGKRTPVLGLRAADEMGPMPMHKFMAQDMLVVTIAVVFSVLAPLVLIPCIIFCIFSRIVWTYQFLYVYESCCETGGMYWPVIYRRSTFALQMAQATLMGTFMLKGAWVQVYIVAALMIGTYWYLKKQRVKFDVVSSSLPLEVANFKDAACHAVHPNYDEDESELTTLSYLNPFLRSKPVASPETTKIGRELNREAFPRMGGIRLVTTSDVTEEVLTRTEDARLENLVKDGFGGSLTVVSNMKDDGLLIERKWNAELGKEKGFWNVLLVLAGVKSGGLISPDAEWDAMVGGFDPVTLPKYSKLV